MTRTTINTGPLVLAQAKALARTRGASLSETVSDLLATELAKGRPNPNYGRKTTEDGHANDC